MEWKYYSQPYSEKLIFEEKLADGREVIIKFVLTYNEEAHKLLASAGYTPQLHYVSRKLYGGLRMVVMDRVLGRMLEDVGQLSPPQYTDSKKVPELLHRAGIVHGDVRPPNIILIKEKKKGMDERMEGETKKDGEVMLVDFDECKKVGEGSTQQI